ncbi:MAG: hypothetical protein H6608_09530 [Flavobacteriales bacterium]|nr:hypothetical protein [Bacteroidota bacterium]MCB9241362.1 hypothetical protein [Flavobacteriales bacterium]
MARIFSFLLVLVLNLQLMGSLYYLSWYSANKEWIALELCINRDDANNTCQGKCVLGQKIKQLDTEQNQLFSLLELRQIPTILPSVQRPYLDSGRLIEPSTPPPLIYDDPYITYTIPPS